MLSPSCFAILQALDAWTWSKFLKEPAFPANSVSLSVFLEASPAYIDASTIWFSSRHLFPMKPCSSPKLLVDNLAI